MAQKSQIETTTYTEAGTVTAFTQPCYGSGSLVFYVKNNDTINALDSMTLQGYNGGEWHTVSLISNNFTTYNALAASTSKVFIANVARYTKVRLRVVVTAAGSVKTQRWIAAQQPQALDSETMDDMLSELEDLNTVLGATDDDIVDAGAIGSLSAKLRRLTNDLDALNDKVGLTNSAVVDAGAVGDLSAKLRRLTTDLDALNDKVGLTNSAVVDAGAVGDLSAKIRRLTTDLGALLIQVGDTDSAIVSAGAVGDLSAKIRRISSDVDAVKTATEALNTTIGATTDVAVEGDAVGTISAKLRGLQKVLGAVADAAATAGDTGSVSAKLRIATSLLNDIKVALQIIDDWDESDRAKVNLIVGQAGISANAGVMDASTIRTTIATDDTHFGSVGATEDADGVLHAQVLYLANRLDALETSVDVLETTVDTVNDQLKIEEQSPSNTSNSTTLMLDGVSATTESSYVVLLRNGKGPASIYGAVTITSGTVDIDVTVCDADEEVEYEMDTETFSATDTFLIELPNVTGKVKIKATISDTATVSASLDTRGNK